MSIRTFDGSTDKYLTNTNPPFTGYPFTVGAWATLTAVPGAGYALWTVFNGSGDDTISVFTGYGATFNFELWQGGGTDDVLSVSPTLTAGAWYYILARGISATNKRLSVLNPDGSISHAASTTSSTPASLTTYGIGCYNLAYTGYVLSWRDSIAELFVANADVQPDGDQTQDALLRKLAYEGPFSMPHIRGNVVDYRSFRSTWANLIGESYGIKNSALTPVSTPVIANHPALTSSYVSPAVSRLPLMI